MPNTKQTMPMMNAITSERRFLRQDRTRPRLLLGMHVASRKANMIPALPLGHAIGRLGCLAYGCCYGRVWEPGLCFPVGSPAFMDHLDHNRLAIGAAESLPLFPTQLVESGLNLIVFFILLKLARRKKFTGQVFATYLMLYAPIRFALEFFRADWRGGEFLALSVSQWISIALLAFGAALFAALRRAPRPSALPRRK